jgi:hypothetical protein
MNSITQGSLIQPSGDMTRQEDAQSYVDGATMSGSITPGAEKKMLVSRVGTW